MQDQYYNLSDFPERLLSNRGDDEVEDDDDDDDKGANSYTN